MDHRWVMLCAQCSPDVSSRRRPSSVTKRGFLLKIAGQAAWHETWHLSSSLLGLALGLPSVSPAPLFSTLLSGFLGAELAPQGEICPCGSSQHSRKQRGFEGAGWRGGEAPCQPRGVVDVGSGAPEATAECKELTYAKELPQISIIFIFVNEALSVILRSVHSAVNHTPTHLLKEVILVDDNSDEEELKGPLEEYVHKRYPGLVKVVRNQKREGLIRARIEGWKAATGQVTGFFDAHVEFTAGWAEPVLSRIQENRKRVILPSIDNIKQDTFEVQRYENSAHGYSWELWCMYISPPKDWWDAGDPSLPIRTPAMIGCSFVVNRRFFGDIGLLDPGMDVYGGENIELGIKVWLCGGSMEVLPCSRVAHIERKKKPYNSNIGFYTKRNALRVAEVWMDDYKSHVYIAWNLPLENPGIDIGDVSERRALRKSLKCKNFQWYLDHVYPEMRRYNNTVAYGELRNSKAKDVCLDQGPVENHTAILYPCHGWGPQLARYTKEGLLHLGALGTTTLLPDTRCLVDSAKSRLPQLLDCDKVKSSLHKRWAFIQNGAIMNKGTGRCLEVENRGLAGLDLILRPCTGQRWTIKNYIK
ncbi:polypeptide N-acetylgalactosaminyltransferase 17-like [Thomomys bottae]